MSSCGVTEVGQHCSGNDMLPDGSKQWISVDLPSMKSSGLEPEDYFTQVHKLDSTWDDICMLKLLYISFCIYDCKHIEVLISIPVVIGIDTNIEVIVVSLTTWEAHHSPGAKPEGCGELPRSLMRQQWPKLRYQFLFYHDVYFLFIFSLWF